MMSQTNTLAMGGGQLAQTGGQTQLPTKLVGQIQVIFFVQCIIAKM